MGVRGGQGPHKGQGKPQGDSWPPPGYPDPHSGDFLNWPTPPVAPPGRPSPSPSPSPSPRSQGVNGFSAGGYSPFGPPPQTQQPLSGQQRYIPPSPGMPYPSKWPRSMSLGSMGWGG